MNLFSKLFECNDIKNPVVDDDEGVNAESYIEHSDDMMAQCNCQDKLSTYAEFCKQHENDVPNLGANRQTVVITNPINIATDEDGKSMPTTTSVPNSESEQSPVVDNPDEGTATDSTAAEQQSEEKAKESVADDNSAQAEAEAEGKAEASIKAPEGDDGECGDGGCGDGEDCKKLEEKKSHVAAIMKEIDAVKLPEDAEFDKNADLIEEPANDNVDEPKDKATQQDVVAAATNNGADTIPTDEPAPDTNETPEQSPSMYILATIEDGGVVRHAVFSSTNIEFDRLSQMGIGETLTTKSGCKVTKLSDPIAMDEYANKIIQ